MLYLAPPALLGYDGTPTFLIFLLEVIPEAETVF
jgi:hypothetical protein